MVVLVADLVDSSYAELRLSDLSPQPQPQQGEQELKENDAVRGAEGSAHADALLREVKAHLGWLALLGEPQPQPQPKQKEEADAEGEEVGEEAQGKDDNPLPPPPPPTPQQEQQNDSSSSDMPLPPPPPLPQPSSGSSSAQKAKAAPSSSAPVLALLPDYRSRLLHMALLLQGPATLSLLDVELRERLVGLALTLPLAPADADSDGDDDDEGVEAVRQRQAPQRAALVLAVNTFCDGIVLAATALHTQAAAQPQVPLQTSPRPDKM